LTKRSDSTSIFRFELYNTYNGRIGPKSFVFDWLGSWRMIMGRRDWHINEEEFLKENYATLTIKELQLNIYKLSGRNRSADSINAKIKRMRAGGVLEGYKEGDTVNRALIQRQIKDFSQIDNKINP